MVEYNIINPQFRESDDLVADIKFAVGGVMILAMFIVGITGNMLLFILLSKQVVIFPLRNIIVVRVKFILANTLGIASWNHFNKF